MLSDWQAFLTELNAAAPVQDDPLDSTITRITGLNNNTIAPDTHTVVQLASYPLISQGHTHSIFEPRTTELIIQGHPGIGKCTSIVFYLKEAMQRNVPFVYSSADDTNAIFYGWFPVAAGESVAQGAAIYTATDNWKANKNLIWFLNQREHGPFTSARCRKVLVSSPQRNNYKNFEKHFINIKFLFMPLPSEAEVRAIARLYQDYPVNEVEVGRRIGIVGRVPRKVCSVQFDLEDEGIAEALHHCSYERGIFTSKVLVNGTDCAHRIFAFNADPVTLMPAAKTFLSDEIQRRYMAAWKVQNQTSFRLFLATENSDPGLGTQYGKAFELHAHSVLAAGGIFRCRVVERLGGIVPVRVLTRNVTLTNRTMTLIDNTTNFENVHHGHYLTPRSGNFSAVDSLVMVSAPRVTDLYQITVHPQHPIDGPGLEQLLTLLDAQLPNPNTRTYRFIFVVPHYMAQDFHRQTITAPAGVNGLSDAHRARVEQWVLGVNVNIKNIA